MSSCFPEGPRIITALTRNINVELLTHLRPRVASSNTDGSGVPRNCKQHAETGMVHVVSRRCSHTSCIKPARCNVHSGKGAMYYENLAGNGMVDICRRRCSRDTCTRRSMFNVVEIDKPMYCKQHTNDGMANVIGQALHVQGLHGTTDP